MAISSSNISPAKGSSESSSPSKLEQKKRKFFKKKMVGPAKKRVLRRTPVTLTGKTTSPKKLGYKKTGKNIFDNIQEEIDNTTMSQQLSVLSPISSSSGHGEVKSPAMDQAKEIQAKLPSKFPSFVKYMLKSHVTSGFWLGLSKSFCDLHLPMQDATISLVGEEGVKEYKTNYLKRGLSGGWRGFTLAHKLVEGDVLVFHLIESLKFKVYIARASKTAEINGSASLLNSHSQPKALEIAYIENEFEDVKNVEMIIGDDRAIRRSDQPVSEGIRLANKSIVQFQDVKGFDSFSIIVDGLAIETDIPTHLLYKYYKLCHNQNSFLHNDLVKGLNRTLAAGIISETVNIADAIKPAKLTVSLERLQSLEKTLKAFEDMGMKVGFIRARINKLECLLYEEHEMIRLKKVAQTRLEEEIRDVESEQLKRYETKIAMDAEIEALLGKNSSFEVTLENADTAEW